MTPETRYLRTPDGTYIAYQVVGAGPVDIAVDFHSLLSNVDLMWDEPIWGPYLRGASEFARVILHDRRGLGQSSRNVPAPTLETRLGDQLAVLDAAGSERPILLSAGPTGAMHVLLAATHPERVGGLVWMIPSARAAWAPDYPWGGGPAEFEASMRQVEAWGSPEHIHKLVREISEEVPGGRWELTPGLIDTYGRIVRNTATPDVAREMERMWWDTDVRPVLPAVQAPVLLLTGAGHDPALAAYIGSLVPDATVADLGADIVSTRRGLDEIRRFAGIESPPPEVETILTTVLFTDIVDSTTRQAALGDRGWRELVEAHHKFVRDALQRWRGVEADTAGDGFYATFDGPARAIRCALEIAAGVRPLGIEIRAGVHTGECEVADGKCAGLTVSIGARVAAAAGPSQVLVSQTVRDLVAGSGLTFTDLGEGELKGVPGTWHLYQAS